MSQSADIERLLARGSSGALPTRAEALSLATCTDVAALSATAERLTLAGHGRRVSYSRKVFIPLTHLCRDVCGYCTFTKPPKPGQPVYLSREAVLDIARKGDSRLRAERAGAGADARQRTNLAGYSIDRGDDELPEQGR